MGIADYENPLALAAVSRFEKAMRGVSGNKKLDEQPWVVHPVICVDYFCCLVILSSDELFPNDGIERQFTSALDGKRDACC